MNITIEKFIGAQSKNAVWYKWMSIDRTSNIGPNVWYSIIYVTYRDIIVYSTSIVNLHCKVKLIDTSSSLTAAFQVREIKAPKSVIKTLSP